MGKKIIVLGAGLVGHVMAKDLARDFDVTAAVGSGGYRCGAEAGGDVRVFVGRLIFRAIVLDGGDVAAGLVDFEDEVGACVDGVRAADAGYAEDG